MNEIFEEYFAQECKTLAGCIVRLTASLQEFTAVRIPYLSISFADEDEYWKYGTRKQRHLLWYGSPKEQKKWRNALLRKQRIARKRSEQ